MRICRLALTRYGRFTGFGLDFGARPESSPDLHLVYGPNEAGKSTIFAAVVDLLFGMPRITAYNFLHENAALRIDADIEIKGPPKTYARIKANKNDLLGDGDRALPAAALEPGLGRLDRDGFLQMFSLDEATLAKGGEGLIDARGNFGEMLYGASSGVAGLSERLAALAAEADAIRRPRARGDSTELGRLRLRRDALKAEKAAADVQASEYRRLIDARERARAAEAEAAAALKAGREDADRLDRRAAALPALERLREVREELAPLAGMPDAPAGWDARIPRLQETAARLAAERAAAERRLREQTKRLEEAPPDDPILALADRLESPTFASARSRADTAAADLPNREAALADLDADLTEGAARLGAGDARSLELSAAKAGEIERLLEAWPKLQARAEAAAEEVAKAEAAMAVTAGADAVEALPRLQAAIEEADASDAAARLADRREAAEDAAARLLAALDGLTPWRGDSAALRALAAPPAQSLAEWAAAREAAGKRRDRLEERVRDLAGKMAEAEGAAEVAAAGARAPDDAAFAELRARRDAAWRTHLDGLAPETAAAFGDLLAETDRAADARAAHGVDLAALRSAETALLQACRALTKAKEDLAAAAAEAAALEDRVGTAATALGLPDETDLPMLADWIRRRERALDAAERSDAAAATRAACEAEVRNLAERLSAALAAAGAAPPDGAGLTSLRTLARESSLALRERARAGAELARRSESRNAVAVEIASWRGDWAEATAGTWLDGAEPAAARSAMAAWTKLRGDLAARDDLARRTRDMRRDAAAFRAAVAEIAEALDIPCPCPGDADALAAADGFRRRLAEARTRSALRRETAEAVDAGRRDLAALAETEAAHAGDADEVLAYFGAETLDAAAAALRAVGKRDELDAERRRLARAIADAAGEDDPAAAEAALAALDPATLAADLAAARDRANAAERASHEAYAARTQAEREVAAVGADAKAATLEQQRQTALLEAQAAAERYLRLKLGALAAEHALDAYRARHRTQMLERASAAFARITRGSFRGLATQADGRQEKLIAVRADGAARLVDSAMSAGTRAQLYLALRIAGYHEFAAAQTPPPFVADDILETFDDERAAETFQALAEMAGIGQVIYLTHHEHLIPIAEAAAPGVKVHRLPDPLAG